MKQQPKTQERKQKRNFGRMMRKIESLGRKKLRLTGEGDIADRVVATSFGVTELLRRITEHKKRYPPTIIVLDAPTWEGFLKNAWQAYKAAHPSESKRRGRRSKVDDVMGWLVELQQKLGRIPTHKEMMETLTEGHPPKKIAKNTADKFVKLYCLWKRSPRRLSDQQKEWLRKHFGEESLSEFWWLEKGWKWNGLLDEISKYFQMPGYSTVQLCEERKELEALRIKYTFGKS